MREYVECGLILLKKLPRKLAWLIRSKVDPGWESRRQNAEREKTWSGAVGDGASLSETGVCIAVDLPELKSLSQIGRDFIDCLSTSDIPFEVFDMSVRGCGAPVITEEEYASYRQSAVKTISQKRVVVFAAGQIVKSKRVFNILTPFWEFESGLLEVSPNLFDGVGHVIAFSDFCANYFRSIAPAGVGVSKVRYPLPRMWKAKASREFVRGRFGIRLEAFVVFFHFDFRSGYDRKNPEAVLESFKLAMGNDENARLVIKAGGRDWDLRNYLKFNRKLKESGLVDRVIVLWDFIPHQDILDLIAASDAYISLHRGEGFGIGMLEAMCVGTPVIATNYGGNTDFTKPETAFLVGYRMVRPNTSYGLYAYVSEWPEPDVDQAAECLRKLRQDRTLGQQKVRNATKFIQDFYSERRFADDVKQVLRDTMTKVDLKT